MLRKSAAWIGALVALSIAGISSCSTETPSAPPATSTSILPGGPTAAPAAAVFDRADFLAR
jgi:hypothetical protein